MARKEKTVVIDAAGRDKDKAFFITEMSARKAEDWAIRAFMGMAAAGVEVPEEVEAMGMAGMAALGLKAVFSIPYADAKPLLDEMLSCIQIIPDPSNSAIRRNLFEEDIEEIPTYLTLRREVFELHVNFSELVDRLALTQKKAE